MQIIDAIRRAATAQDVCFLLTSYVETLPFYDTARHLPATVMALPVRGLDDIVTRLAGLHDARHRDTDGHAQGKHKADCTECAIIDEATNLFNEALSRLQSLDVADTANFSFERRIGARSNQSLRL